MKVYFYANLKLHITISCIFSVFRVEIISIFGEGLIMSDETSTSLNVLQDRTFVSVPVSSRKSMVTLLIDKFVCYEPDNNYFYMNRFHVKVI